MKKNVKKMHIEEYKKYREEKRKKYREEELKKRHIEKLKEEELKDKKREEEELNEEVKKYREEHKEELNENYKKYCENLKEYRKRITYPEEFNNNLKTLIRNRYHNVCRLCGKTFNLKRKLSVHHIDYNKDNNNPENLISLCDRCHSMTNRNRKEWIKFFARQKDKEIQITFK